MISLEIQIENDLESGLGDVLGDAPNGTLGDTLDGTLKRGGDNETEDADSEDTAAEGTEGKQTAADAEKKSAKKIFICSPYHPEGETEEETQTNLNNNIRFARFAASCVILRGGIPYAPHLYFPALLDEDDPEDREKGIRLGLEWLQECDEMWVAGPRISEGMRREVKAAHELGIPMKRILMGENSRDRMIEAILLMTDDEGNLL